MPSKANYAHYTQRALFQSHSSSYHSNRRFCRLPSLIAQGEGTYIFS